MLNIGVWNVCGWGLDPSHRLRGNVIKALKLDVICICESFLTGDGDHEILLEGYTWLGNNRKAISKRAIRGSGGVGILVSNRILEQSYVAGA